MATPDPLTPSPGQGSQTAAVRFFFFSFFLFYLFRAAPVAYGGSQARDQTQATAVTQAPAVTMLDP